MTAIFYDVTAGDHVFGIRDYLERIVEFSDDDLTYIHKKKRVSAKREPHKLWTVIERLEKKAERYEITDAQDGYLKLFRRTDFESLPNTVQIAILEGIVFCYGAQKLFADAEQYVDIVLDKYELTSAADSVILMLVQQLFDSFEWDKAFELIGKVREKDRCLEFFRDLFETQKQLIVRKPLPGEQVKVYGQTDLDEDEKAARRFLYKNLKNKYIAADGISLTDEDQYADEFRKELVYYWLGAMAGQLFHQHKDAISYLYQAYRMRPLAIYQEELGHNYHMLGIEQVRYRENSKCYELDRVSLMKAKRCFELVIHDSDTNMRASMIGSCGHDLKYMKAEHDARYHLRLDDDLITDFDGPDQVQIEAEYYYSSACAAADRGDPDTCERMSQKVIALLENRKDLSVRTSFGLLLLDAAFNVKNLELHHKCRLILERQGQSNMIVEARELELEGRLDEADKKYMQAFEEHPDISTVVIVKSFYIRNGLKDKLFALYGRIDAEYPELTEIDAGFYSSWIQMKIRYGEINDAILLYAKYEAKFKNEMDRREVEEMLKPIALDFGDIDERIDFLNGMLEHCPKNVQIQFVENMLQLDLWRIRVEMLLHPATFGVRVFDARQPVYSCLQCEDKIKHAHRNIHYHTEGMGLAGRESIMPMWVFLMLVYERRELELARIKCIYISYAALFMLQDGMLRAGDTLIWRANELFQNVDNVKFFAPTLSGLAKETGTDRHVNLERAQIHAYAQEHPDLEIFMEEMIE